MAKEPEAKEQAPAAPPKAPGVLKWIVLGIVFSLVTSGAVGGVLWFLLKPAPPPAEAAAAAAKEGEPKEETKPSEPKGIVALEPFVVNLADKDANRFLRVTLQLAVESEKEAAEIEENAVHKARLRSAVIETLTLQISDKLVTPEGKAELKKAIAERATKALGEVKVFDVLFTDFVVQF